MGREAVGSVEPFEAVLAAAQRGDREALGRLWRRWNPAVVRYLRARGTPDAEDVASSTWIDVASGVRRFSGGPDDFRRWLFTIAHRRAVDELRRAARRPAAQEAVPEDGPMTTSAEEEAVCSDALDRAILLVRRLPADQAEVILLRVVADLDVAAVAAIVGRSPGAVRVLSHRGLTRLASLVPESGEPAPIDRNVATPRVAPTMKAVT
jgi:RNA polymerase sigma-70 factor (ECF subfamily)